MEVASNDDPPTVITHTALRLGMAIALAKQKDMQQKRLLRRHKSKHFSKRDEHISQRQWVELSLLFLENRRITLKRSTGYRLRDPLLND